MNFKVKIFIAAIGILLSALVLNSILSISLFESIYSRSLTSVLESAGKNLQQGIERGLRLGKPLEAYDGMAAKLEKFLTDNPGATSVGVSDTEGEILYFTGKNNQGLGILSGHAENHLPVTEAETHFVDDHYLIYVPLFQRDTLPAGAVFVSMSRQNVLEKTREMITGAMVRLGWTLAPTALILVLILGLFVVRPVRKDLERIRQSLLPYMGRPDRERQYTGSKTDGKIPGVGDWQPVNARKPGQEHVYDFRRVRNEIRRLGIFLYAVAIAVDSDMRHLRDISRSFPELENIRKNLEQCSVRLEALLHDTDTPEAFHCDLEALLQENRRILNLIDGLVYGKHRAPATEALKGEPGGRERS